MVAAGAEAGVVRQGVVDPPDPRGHEVGEDHVDGVVAAGDQEEDDPAQRHDEGGPVEQLETPRRVCGEKISCLQQHARCLRYSHCFIAR